MKYRKIRVSDFNVQEHITVGPNSYELISEAGETLQYKFKVSVLSNGQFQMRVPADWYHILDNFSHVPEEHKNVPQFNRYIRTKSGAYPTNADPHLLRTDFMQDCRALFLFLLNTWNQCETIKEAVLLVSFKHTVTYYQDPEGNKCVVRRTGDNVHFGTFSTKWAQPEFSVEFSCVPRVKITHKSGDSVGVQYERDFGADLDDGGTPFVDEFQWCFLNTMQMSHYTPSTYIEIPYTADTAQRFIDLFDEMADSAHRLSDIFQNTDSLLSELTKNYRIPDLGKPADDLND